MLEAIPEIVECPENAAFRLTNDIVIGFLGIQNLTVFVKTNSKWNSRVSLSAQLANVKGKPFLES